MRLPGADPRHLRPPIQTFSFKPSKLRNGQADPSHLPAPPGPALTSGEGVRMRVCSRRASSAHQIAHIHQPAGRQLTKAPEPGCRRERGSSQGSGGASGPSEPRCSAERSSREPVAAKEVTSSRPTRLGILSPAAYPPDPKMEEPTDPTMSSDPSAPPAVPPLHSPKSPVWPTFPFQREGSRIWERGNLLLRDLPSPLPTKRTRTYSATARASAGPIFKGVCKQFSRSQGHGFITPENGTEDIFVHVSDIEGEYVPVEGDEVTYKVCPIPPKNQKFQAVEVVLTNLAPHTKHETWSGQIIGS